jgi:hypothetical protein
LQSTSPITLDPACLSNITLTGRSVAASLLACQSEAEAVAASSALLHAMDEAVNPHVDDDLPSAASSFSHTLPRSAHNHHHHNNHAVFHHTPWGTAEERGGGQERSKGAKMAAVGGPRLTTCQLQPCCSNPSFETFVSARAASNGSSSMAGAAASRCSGDGSCSKQLPMSVVDILRDLRSTSEACAAATARGLATGRLYQPPPPPHAEAKMSAAAGGDTRTAMGNNNSSGSEIQQQHHQRHLCKPVICPKAGFHALSSTADKKYQDLKVHKIENFFGSEFEFHTISLLVMLKY